MGFTVSFLPLSMVDSWALPLLQLLAQNSTEKRSINGGNVWNDFFILFYCYFPLAGNYFVYNLCDVKIVDFSDIAIFFTECLLEGYLVKK